MDSSCLSPTLGNEVGGMGGIGGMGGMNGLLPTPVEEGDVDMDMDMGMGVVGMEFESAGGGREEVMRPWLTSLRGGGWQGVGTDERVVS